MTDPQDAEATRLGADSARYAPADALPLAGQRLGKYVVLAELGRGGMGVVLRAHDTALGREVALKLVDPARADAEYLRRFAVEARAGAALRHPGIVGVLEAGTVDGRPFLAMELVEGESFEALLRRDPPPVRRAVEVVRDVARALEHAHAHGVVHRDVKPENVLLERDGRPRLGDFGLAKQVQGAERLTRTGEVLGTPAYMAPEQANGDPQDARTDVYQLGGVLYRALCGRPPFQAAGLQQLLKHIFLDEPTPPRALRPRLHPDLETIALRCLEKDPARRYARAGDVADELERWLDGEPIEARPVGRLGRARRWTAKNPRLAAACAALLVLAPLAKVLLWRLSVLEAREAAHEAQDAAHRVAEARAARTAAFLAALDVHDPAALLDHADRALAAPASTAGDLDLSSGEREVLLRARRVDALERLAEVDVYGPDGRSAFDPARAAGRWARVRQDARDLARLDPARASRWRFHAALAARGQGQSDAARALLEPLRADAQAGAYALLARGLLEAPEAAARDAAHALPVGDAVVRGLALAADDVGAQVAGALTLLELGRVEDARRVLLALEAADPHPHCVVPVRVRWLDRLLEGVAAGRDGNLAAALPAFEQVHHAWPGLRPVMNQLMTAYLGLQRFEDTVAVCDELLATFGEQLDPLMHRGIARAHLKRSREAIADLEKVIALEPAAGRGHFLIALPLMDLLQLDEALSHLDRAVELADSPDVRVRRAKVLAALHRDAEALRDCERALELGGRTSRVRPEVDAIRAHLAGRAR